MKNPSRLPLSALSILASAAFFLVAPAEAQSFGGRRTPAPSVTADQNTTSTDSSSAYDSRTGTAVTLSTDGTKFVRTSDELIPAGKLNLVITGGNIIEDGKKVAPATVGSVLEYIGKKDSSFSYILTPGVANTEVADMVLHNVRVTDFSRALMQATDGQLMVSFDRASPTPILQVSGTNSSQPGLMAFNLRSYLYGASKMTLGDVMVRWSNMDPAAAAEWAQSLAGNTPTPSSGNSALPTPAPGPTPKEIATKIDSLIDMIRKTVNGIDDKQGTLMKSLRFEFHEGSSVLVVIGQERALSAARQVINAFQGTSATGAGRSTNPVSAVGSSRDNPFRTTPALDTSSARWAMLGAYLDEAAADPSLTPQQRDAQLRDQIIKMEQYMGDLRRRSDAIENAMKNAAQAPSDSFPAPAVQIAPAPSSTGGSSR